MLYVCVRYVMDGVFYVLFCGMLMCIIWQFSICYVLTDLQFVNTGRGCKGRSYGRGTLQCKSHDRLVGNHILLQRVFLLFLEVCVHALIICCQRVCCV